MELVSIVVQAITSVVAVVIAVISLVWTNKIQRDAEKPYIYAYLQNIKSSDTLITYLIIKNFGKTGAVITNVTSSPDIKSGGLKFKNNPFSSFKNQLIAPGQTYAAGIGIGNSSAELETKEFQLQIEYLDNRKEIKKENFSLNADALHDVEHFIPEPINADGIVKAIYKVSAENLVSRL